MKLKTLIRVSVFVVALLILADALNRRATYQSHQSVTVGPEFGQEAMAIGCVRSVETDGPNATIWVRRGFAELTQQQQDKILQRLRNALPAGGLLTINQGETP